MNTGIEGHTPTPWARETSPFPETMISRYAQLPDANWDTSSVASAFGRDTREAIANADFIVTACNAHDDLVAALRFYMMICGNTAASVSRQSAGEAYELARAALAKASAS